MCGVFLGIRCSLRDSRKLNWTINIPDKESNQFNDLTSMKRELPSASYPISYASQAKKRPQKSSITDEDDRSPSDALFISDLNTKDLFKRLGGNKEREARVDWTGSIPSKIRKAFSHQRRTKDEMENKLLNDDGKDDELDRRGISMISMAKKGIREEKKEDMKRKVVHENDDRKDRNTLEMQLGRRNTHGMTRISSQEVTTTKSRRRTSYDKNNADGRSANLSTSASYMKKKGPLKVLQITDIHFDPYFSPGARTDCGEPVCCRSNNGPGTTFHSMAGIWGDYTECDTPVSF